MKEKEKKKKKRKEKKRERRRQLLDPGRSPVIRSEKNRFENIQYHRFTLLFTEKNRGEEKSFTMLHAHLSVILSHYFQTATRRKMKITSIRSQLYITEHGGSSFDAKKK